MPRLPKPEAIRVGRRRYAGSARLPPETRPIKRRPRLPPGRTWREETRLWWIEIWESPQAGEFLRSDVPALLRLAMLIDLFWAEPSKALGAEIRMQEANFGLTPLSRRRLEWTIAQAESAADRSDRSRSRRATLIIDDPRSTLGHED
jgi:hypothetical protein